MLLLAVVVLALLNLSSCGSSTGQVEREDTTTGVPDKPNVLFVLTDDQDVESVAHMPHLQERLMDEGTTFENAFVTDSLCCPSRASILRGQYPHNHQVQFNNAPLGGYKAFEAQGLEGSTVATWLDDAGYRTALFGKYLNQYGLGGETYTPPGWDYWFANMYEMEDQRYTDNGEVVTYDPDQYMETDVLSDKAVQYLEDTKDDPEPFFMYIAPYAPHEPAWPAPRHKGMFDDQPLPRPPNFDEEDVSDKPQYIQGKSRLERRDIRRIEKAYRNRLETLQAVDEMVDRLVDTLQDTGKLENTYVVYMSDNGFHMGNHRLKASKNTDYEEDIRVPLVVRGPGVPAGQALDHLVINNDIAPTFAELAGASTPDFVDGRSFVPLLGSSPPDVDAWRTGFMVEAYQQKNSLLGAKTSLGVRTRENAYIKYVDYVPGRLTGGQYDSEPGYTKGQFVSEGNEWELYDIVQDPYELENLEGTADGELVDDLEARWDALRTCAGESCRVAEDR